MISNEKINLQTEFEDNTIKTGMAGFIFLAMQYVKLNSGIHEKLKKKNQHIRLVLEAPDFYPAARLTIQGQEIIVDALSQRSCQLSSNYDTKMIATGEMFLNYFMGDLGTLRPFMFFKIAAKNLLKLTQLIWFIHENQRFFAPNRAFARAVFFQLFNAQQKNK